MKKNANKVIILVMIISLIILVAAFGFKALFLDGIENEVKELVTDIENTISTDDEIDDVEGWEIIAKSAGGSIAGGMYIVVLIFFVVIPVMIAISSAIWCLLGRLFMIGQEEKWKYNVFRFFIIIYDILMIIILSIFGIFSIYTFIIAILIFSLIAYNFYILFMKKESNVLENIVAENQNKE